MGLHILEEYFYSNLIDSGNLGCDSVEDAHSDTVQTLLALLGAEVGPITGQVGVTCNPISVIAVSGNNWYGISSLFKGPRLIILL